jgi:YHS domain-containing protein/mono/diheme cytochrome c family protein
MKSSSLILFAAACAMILTAAACRKGSSPESVALRAKATLGEKIFVEKECGKCHIGGDSAATPEMSAPDLTSVFLASDTVFVKAHLRFSELSKMPPITLTPEEIGALTQYIASLHARAKGDSHLRNPDGLCPVCGASLKVDQARAGQLEASHDGKAYYFECADCKRVFEMNADWYVQHGYVATR